jgi:hypothetical protein
MQGKENKDEIGKETFERRNTEKYERNGGGDWKGGG